MFKKYDNVYIKHNSYTDTRQIGGLVGYVVDVAKDMYNVMIPKADKTLDYVLHDYELESLEPKHGYPQAELALGYVEREKVENLTRPYHTTEYWKGYTDGMARAIELFTEGANNER